MNKKILLLAISMLLVGGNANALTIKMTDDVDCDNPIAIGCYDWGKDEKEIRLKDTLQGLSLINVFIHELGHHYTVRNLERKEYEIIANNYEKYIAQEMLMVNIEKRYIRYFNEDNVYDYNTGRKISYDEAARNNIWDNVQILPFYNKILFKYEYMELVLILNKYKQ